MKKIALTLLLASSIASAKTIEGVAVLWEKKPCLPNTKCELPKPLNEPKLFSFYTNDESAPGTYPATSVTLKLKNYNVHIEFYSVIKSDQKPYFVSQMFLSHERDGLIAQCSDYSEIAITNFFPVGSCSGIYKDQQIGVSFLKPKSSDK